MSDAGYEEVYQDWLKRPEDFWARAANGIAWFKLWDKVFDPYMGQYGRWFTGGETNAAYNCLDRHILAGHGEATAVVCDGISAASGHDKPTITYADLASDVAALAGVLTDRGVKSGERVLIHMPMSPEALTGMLACARIGAVHCIAGVEVGATELARRLDHITPVAILSSAAALQDGQWVPIKPALDEAIASAGHKPSTNIVLMASQVDLPFTQGRDIAWAEAVGEAKNRGRAAACVPVAATAPLYILYADGLSGGSEAVVRDTGGAMTVLRWTFENVFGVSCSDTFWSAAHLESAEGHAYACYGPLLVGGTTVISANGASGVAGNTAAVSRLLKEYGVSAMHAPTNWFSGLQNSGNSERIETAGLEVVFMSGPTFDSDIVTWAENAFDLPVVAQLSSPLAGGVYAMNPKGLGVDLSAPATAAMPVPGYRLEAMNGSGGPAPDDVAGDVVIKLPLPPSGATTLWNGDQEFRARYVTAYPGFMTTGLAGAASSTGLVVLNDRPSAGIEARVTTPAALVSGTHDVSPTREFEPPHRHSLGCFGGGIAGRLAQRTAAQTAGAAAMGASADVFVAPQLRSPAAVPHRQTVGCYGGGHAGRVLASSPHEGLGWAAAAPQTLRPLPRQTVGCYGGGLSGRKPAFGFAPVFAARQSTGCYGGGTAGLLSPGLRDYPGPGGLRQTVGCYGGGHAGRA